MYISHICLTRHNKRHSDDRDTLQKMLLPNSRNRVKCNKH